MSDFSDWYKSVPIFTRYWLSASVIFTLIGRFNIIHPTYLILLYEPISKFQLWRLITCIFYYPLSPGTGFHYLINLYFLYNYSQRLETGFYQGKPADYFFMLIFNWICCVLLGLFLNLYYLMDPMVLSVLYVWCQLNKDVIVNFWFGTQFKAIYLPWVLLAFNMVINGGGLVEILGILIGHLYFFLTFIYPQQVGGRQILSTPTILKSWFPNISGGVHGFGVPPQRPAAASANQAAAGANRRNWGTGYVLGGN